MHRLLVGIIRPVLWGALVVFLGTGLAVSGELDDSALFVEAFNAYQKKDYLLAIEKVGQINQAFPDTPLRDVTLLLLARSGWKSGDAELAGRTVNQFSAEFPDSSLTSTIEDELQNLAARQRRGERLPFNKQLRAAAQKVRSDQLAIERAAALKAEQARLAAEKAERERIAQAKAEAERKERERLAAEKAAKESIKLAIVAPAELEPVESGRPGRIPFELTNRGTSAEEFLVSVTAAPELKAVLSVADKPGEALSRLKLAEGETLKAEIAFALPGNRVDGSRTLLPIKAVSARFGDVGFSREFLVTARAPLVRAVVKPVKAKLKAGDTFKYRLSVLNAGSVAARGLTLRAILPRGVDFLDASGSTYRQESASVVTFRLEQLESGHMSEYNLNVKVQEGVAEKQELRCQVEVINSQLQTKETFTSGLAVVQAR